MDDQDQEPVSPAPDQPAAAPSDAGKTCKRCLHTRETHDIKGRQCQQANTQYGLVSCPCSGFEALG